MRVDRSAIYRFRAMFGLGFIALGVVTLWRVATAPAPTNSKIIGVVLALGLIGLGVVRLVQYARIRAAGKT
ncbi:MAG: hypothetical protein JWN27_4130 [Candidatus Eremiobacteraeota bacterium]|jgi:hypothetical protein|nr:hypothetical protein [Candidatus Eremiobacteraeota bacterium]